MGKRNRRCVVPGCMSTIEDAKFRREIQENGHAYCPIHQLDNSLCECTEDTKLVLYKFPSSPGQCSVWSSLIGLNSDHLPSRSDCVCSRHFDGGGSRKVPTLNIGRSAEDILKITQENANRLLRRNEEQKELTRKALGSGIVRMGNIIESEAVDSEEEEEFDLFGK